MMKRIHHGQHGGRTALLNVMCSGSESDRDDGCQGNRETFHFSVFLDNDANKLNNQHTDENEQRRQIAITAI